MTTRSHDAHRSTRDHTDDLVTDFHRRMWPVIDVRARIERVARAAEGPVRPRRSA